MATVKEYALECAQGNYFGRATPLASRIPLSDTSAYLTG
jgi:hypothetical protein